MTDTGLRVKCGLDAGDIAQLRALAEACDRADGIRMKFNWDMMNHRTSGYLSDFCFYHDGQLVGYAPLDDFGTQLEMTAAVMPACRRQGIFRMLFEAARQEAQRRQATELLLVNYRASEAGSAAIRRLGLAYISSEYCMEAEADAIPPLPTGRIDLQEVTPENVDDLSRMLALSFENARWNASEALLQELQRPGKRFYLARLENEIIGQIGVLAQESGLYIRAVGIIPERRRQGYGRQLLAATVHKMLAEGHRHFELDVATENSQALSLYQSCGFREANVYDYYTVPLSPSSA